jgi:hypothetical protein
MRKKESVCTSPAVARPLLGVSQRMKTSTTVALSLGLLLLGPSAAFAQGNRPAQTPGDHPAQAEHPAPAPAPIPADDTSSPPPLPRPSSPSAGPPCRLAEHSGVDDADAGTVAQLVCSALSRAGAPADGRYRVGIGKLGSVFILSVALEGDIFGSTADTREMRLASIEEAATAAPRIAAAIVHGTVIEDIEAPAPSPVPEVPKAPPPSTAAKVHFALGLLGQFPPLDRSATPAAGADLELHAEWSIAEIVTDIRFGGDSSDRSVGITFVEFSMGGRFFTSEADLSPFIGGGFAWSYLAMTDHVHNDFDGSHTGLGAYGELGLEIGRTHHTHLAFGVRLDLPFYSMENDVGAVTVPNPNPPGTFNSAQTPLVIGTLYYAPLSLEIRVTF